MVQALEDCVLIVLFLIFDQAHTVVGVELAGIELIEGQPVIHPVTQTLEQGAGVAHIALHRLAALPAAVLCYQMQWNIVVQNGSEHLDAMGVAGIEQIHVKLQTCLVGLRIIAIGEDACPADRGAQHLDAREDAIAPPQRKSLGKPVFIITHSSLTVPSCSLQRRSQSWTPMQLP